MDKYTKFILTVIAVGIIGINFQLFGGDIISKANAEHSTKSWSKNHIWIDNWPSGCNQKIKKEKNRWDCFLNYLKKR